MPITISELIVVTLILAVILGVSLLIKRDK